MNQLQNIFSLRQKNAEILHFATYVEMTGWSRYLKKPDQILTILQVNTIQTLYMNFKHF